MKKVIVCFLLILTHVARSQESDVFPPSPNASALIEYVNVPVALDKGIPNIDLPLFTFESNNSKVPLTLSYHASGQKVSEIANWMGLGWTLNAGGVITRVIKGLADDAANGFIGVNEKGKLTNQPQLWTPTYLFQSGKGLMDTEPDIYYFNFLNYQGKFTFTSDGDIVMLPHSELKILPAIGPKKIYDYWIVIDPQGNKYKFGATATSVEKSKSTTTYNASSGNETINTGERNTSWYLDEVESATGDKITFTYINGPSTTSLSNLRTLKVENYSGGYGSFTYNIHYNTVTTIINPVYPDKISGTNGYVKFVLDPNFYREDLANGKMLDEIIQYDKNSKLLKKFVIGQQYFLTPGCTSEDCKRLKLLNVTQFDEPGHPIRLYNFEYYTDTYLPSRNSPKFDHWGYYNLNGDTSLEIASLSNRLPNLSGTKANVLKKITYATGGSVTFDYELNKFNKNNVIENAGGLRIKNIIENFGAGSTVTRSYTYTTEIGNYSSGTAYALPVYCSEGVISGTIQGQYSPVAVSASVSQCRSHSLNELYDLNGSGVQYGEVKVSFNDNSSEIHYFSNFVSNPDVRTPSDYNRWIVDGNGNIGIGVAQINPYGSPYSPPSVSRANERGFLTKKIIKDSAGQVVYKLENVYQKLIPTIQYISYGFGISLFGSGQMGLTTYDIGKYTYRNDFCALMSSTETKYDLNDIANGLETLIQFQYSPTHPTQVTQELVNNSDYKQLKTTYQYPFDLVGAESFMDVLTEKNNISNPVIIRNYVNNVEKTAVKKLYNYNTATHPNPAGMPLLAETQEFKDGVLSSSKLFERYDGMGRLLQYRKKGDIPTCIIWGYGGSYPIAKIEGVTYAEITNTSPARSASIEDNDNCAFETCKEEALRNSLNLIRTNLPGARVTTYTYDPMVGVTSITDPRGDTKYFGYDYHKRLKEVRDRDNNILSENEYWYK